MDASRPSTRSRPKAQQRRVQRGYYSEIAGTLTRLQNVKTGPSSFPKLTSSVQTDQYLPSVSKFKTPNNFLSLLTAQKYGPTTQIILSDEFSSISWDPKVQVPFKIESGHTPRKVEIERKKREFLKYDIDKLLEERGVLSSSLMPVADATSRSLRNSQNNRPTPTFPSFLPLEIFDDTEYDCRTPHEWIKLGYESIDVHKPVPGKALLPVLDVFSCSTLNAQSEHTPCTNSRQQSSRRIKSSVGTNRNLPPVKGTWLPPFEQQFEWVDVGMLDYDHKRQLYHVKRVFVPNKILGEKSSSFSEDHNETSGGESNGSDSNGSDNEDSTCNEGHFDSSDNIHYWIPRVRIMFAAENPVLFAERVAKSYHLREKTEALLRYNLYVDCMPSKDIKEISQESLGKMVEVARSSQRLKSSQLDGFTDFLSKEISLDFSRSMNKILFDSTVAENPSLFPFVTLPEPEIDSVHDVPKTGRNPDVPLFPFNEIKQKFQFLSLLTSDEVINAMVKIKEECSRVSDMILFLTGSGKPLKLEEFDQAQGQTSMQVQTYLKETWVPTLRTSIRQCLNNVSKGWFNLEETNWEVYQGSKLKKLMEMTKFAMQDSLRSLVLNSLTLFVQMTTDACYSMINVVPDYQWGEDLKKSDFLPRNSPLFYLELVVDQDSVHYTSSIISFESVMTSIFDRGIQATHSVPQLEKFVVDKLFWPATPLLESVGQHEPEVDTLRNTLCSNLQYAVIPLMAYAKKFEPHLTFLNMDIKEYIQKLNEEEHKSVEIKQLIDKHLKLKSIVEIELPQNIVIGPFFINVDSIRVALSKKHKEIAKALMDFLAKTLRIEADLICEEFKEVSRRLYERPNTIEDLTETREYIKTIPDLVTEHRAVIEKSMNDYQMLDEYFYVLTDEDFEIKWNTIGWPRKISEQVEHTEKQLDDDEQKFQRNLQSDQANFDDRLDTLEIICAGFSGNTDLSRAQETANEVRRVVKNLKECQGLAQLYNQRERLFGQDVTQYDKVGRLMREFEPFKNLWITASDWMRWQESWMNEALVNIDAEMMATNVQMAFKTMHKSVKHFKDTPGCIDVAQEIKLQIENFKPYIPLIQGLRNPGMRNRHWEQLSNTVGFPVYPKSNLTFSKCLDMGLQNHTEAISKVAEVAGKEFSIEQALDKMEQEWESVLLEISSYKDTGTYIMKSGDESAQQLDDHIVMTQAMSFSPYKKPFEQRITTWENKLQTTQEVLEEWALCQKSWLYLEPIFSSDDINRQLPVEGKRFQTMDRMWRKILNNAKQDPKVISFCPDQRLLEHLRECNKLLDQVQKGLSEYLETKRLAFPRFYFLSDDELLEILSQTKDPTAVQPHLRKCFENISKLKFEDDLAITKMYSGEGEEIDFSEVLYPVGNVEDWLLEVERVMRESLRKIIGDSLINYVEIPRTEWVLQWPGQVVIAGCQTMWTTEVSQALDDGKLQDLYQNMLKQLSDLVGLVRGKLTKLGRIIMSALIVIEVHSRDVVSTMVDQKVRNVNDFEWISQLRYYWRDDLFIRAVNAEFIYGYEYLGNTGRLVITPLTDRCYLTLTGALHLKFGGAPAGPAGTGKTETTKDLAKAMAIQCVVFNCSDQLDFMAMGKFFKGLASAGAWACFDEFNRIDIEVLSVVAQQITTIQIAQQEKVSKFMFEGIEISLKPSCAVFITMNPGYAGRTELPDNLKALFRPVAMMVPDYAMIAEIMLFSFGFSDAKTLSKKIVTTFKLSSEQLSSQDHYDFGMRAVKTVISAAGNLKRENPEMNEELILLRAVRDVNVPKFLQDDLKLFSGIVSDLFPKIEDVPVDYGELEQSIRNVAISKGLENVDGFIKKCIQLYETTVVRHGLMLVGPTMSGKTKCYEVLRDALTALQGKSTAGGTPFEAVLTYVLNPKSITMGQLYGEFDPLTHEWTDGILAALVRQGVANDNQDKKWYVFDGPVDAVWIESMNTVLDDNKKLCLSSGEIIKLTEVMTMMFEVQDLAVASPATVSRCGMVYLEPSILGLKPFVRCWLKTIPPALSPYKDTLEHLFYTFLEPSIKFIRKNAKEIVSTVDGNLTFSLMRIMDCFFKPFIPQEEGEEIPKEKIDLLPKLIEPWFLFALVWSIGATSDGPSRAKFSTYLREKCEAECVNMPFPVQGLVYDYKLDDGGVSNLKKGEDEEEDDKKSNQKLTVQWSGWMDNMNDFIVESGMLYADIIVPTMDTVRGSHMIELLLTNEKQVLCVGPTGTGKTLTICDKLLKTMPNKYMSDILSFSARTSANQTQDIIDSKLDKRRKGIFGPPLGKKLIFFIDDLNMPALEVYGAQPPIELIRQWMDHKGWYDRKAIGSFKQLVDIGFICGMGPPGGGRNPITPRLSRHFNYLSFTELEDSSKFKIFSSILKSWMLSFPDSDNLIPKIVNSTISVYQTITTELLPTPAKSHYTFNLRDLSKVFQGILMAPIQKIQEVRHILRLWYHECCRVFQDRLVNTDDRTWFESLLCSKMSDFSVNREEILGDSPVLYGDFLNPNIDVKLYEEITDTAKMTQIMEEYLEDYNQINTAQMKLVLFLDAVKHVTRISRIIRQPLGNALLLGVGGSGRQSLTRLAAHMADYELFQIELSKNYGIAEWKEDIKGCMKKAGLQNTSVVFLFSDTQIKSESFLEDINNILNSGDVPNIYAFEDLDQIYHDMKPIVLDSGLQPTKANLFSAYTKQVRSNIHLVICMSPIGEIFRSRLRQFPSLVNCCTIDWFSEWPNEALNSVAKSFMGDLPEVDDSGVSSGLIKSCVYIHQSVAEKSIQFLSELSRHNYVTPTSYLELLGTYAKLLKIKISEISNQRNRTKTGLDKLLNTSEEVGKLRIELEEMQPLLAQAQVETDETMEQIKKDTAIAEETKGVVQKEEKEANVKAEETQAIADDAQRDLDEALPALDAALASLKSLNKNDVVEVRALQRPPMGVRLVIEAVCIMKEVKPKKVAGEKMGTKVDDYWEPGKGLLQDPAKFLDGLFKFDKDNISEAVIQKITPYIENEDFTPQAISKVSKACTSICLWVRAMHKYHLVAKSVAPKRARLSEAKASLEETLRILNESKARLRDVEEGLQALNAKYEETTAKKEELADKVQLCSARLERAEKLIGGLADEKVRWAESVANFDQMLVDVIGDVMISSGCVAYLGSFTGEYRNDLLNMWRKNLKVNGVPFGDSSSLVSTLGDPVKIRSWQISGLPKDSLSVENGVITQFSRRWPLFIDPQGQANKWIKSMEKNNLDVLKLTDKDFLRSLENAVRFGKPCLLENVGEELDPALEPILLQQTFKQAGSVVIKLGDSVIPYHDDFKLYITTKLPNPHYTPEVSTKVTLVNFTLSPGGLEDQLLGIVVAEERPDLEEAKNALIVSNAKMKQELKEIEDKILYRLSNSEGNPVDDVDLIKTLEASKLKSSEIKTKVFDAEKTEKEIDETRSMYIPVAVRTQLLFFCTTDLANIDPMYQYSLEWFINIFLGSIANAEKSDNLDERIFNINDYFTFSLYSNVCRSLFEKHKLLFSFLLCVRILMNENKINMNEWRLLISGSTSTPQELDNPAPEWLSDRVWKEVLTLPSLEKFSLFALEFIDHADGFKRIFDSQEPHKESLPGHWETDLDSFQKMLVLKCIRLDKLTNAMQDFVAAKLGQRFIEPQTADLSLAFKDSSPTSALIFILSTGTDPAAALYKFAEEMKFTRKLSAISLGQGQGPRAEAMMKSAMDRGQWVFFQNCHLSPSWMPSLERLIEQINPNAVHRDFRLWLTSMPSPKFPVPILQNGSKMTVEPPRGIKANLLKSFLGFSDEFLQENPKTNEFKYLLFSLCLFHGVTLERRKFGPLGFNIPYEFTDGDLRICISQLNMFLKEYDEIPYKVLKYTAGHINYGGRVTDDWDRRCIMNILNDYYNPKVITTSYTFSESGIYHQLQPDDNHKAYMDYIRGLPINDTPEIFSLHENANITYAQNDTTSLLESIVLLQPRSSSGGGLSREDIVAATSNSILEKVPTPIPLDPIMERYPVKYEESMNTVLVQEVIRYNRLLSTVHSTLKDLLKALKGLVVMSQELETMFNSLYNNSVPQLWAKKAYPSLKPLPSWVADLVERIKFIQKWIDCGIPPAFWISGFFFPQAFLTGTLQNFARKAVISIDTITFDFKVLKESVSDLTERPANGCYIYGLFLEGAQWNENTFELGESKPKELYTNMPVMWLIPVANRKQPELGIYICPVYKTLTRAGTLSTTGHSTNYVVAVEIPSSQPQHHWIKRGVALLCALNY